MCTFIRSLWLFLIPKLFARHNRWSPAQARVLREFRRTRTSPRSASLPCSTSRVIRVRQWHVGGERKRAVCCVELWGSPIFFGVHGCRLVWWSLSSAILHVNDEQPSSGRHDFALVTLVRCKTRLCHCEHAMPGKLHSASPPPPPSRLHASKSPTKACNMTIAKPVPFNHIF